MKINEEEEKRRTIELEIAHIEALIRMTAKTAHFGDLKFSEFYEEQVEKIRRLKMILDDIDKYSQ